MARTGHLRFNLADRDRGPLSTQKAGTELSQGRKGLSQRYEMGREEPGLLTLVWFLPRLGPLRP